MCNGVVGATQNTLNRIRWKQEGRKVNKSEPDV